MSGPRYFCNEPRGIRSASAWPNVSLSFITGIMRNVQKDD